MKRTLMVTAIVLACLASHSSASAQTGLVIDPSSLTNTGLTGDDVVTTRTLPTTGTFNFFGSPRLTVSLSTNGNLNFNANTSFSNVALPTAITRIAPLWDDLISTVAAPATSILDNQGDVTNPYYAATWLNIANFGNANARYTFQVVWFNGPFTIGSFNFQAGDIAFDYTNMTNFLQGNATVGLDQGNSSGFRALPGTTNGVITDLSLLPIDDDRFVLFRDDGAGGYNASLQSLSSVPEPATVITLVTGGLGATLVGLRRYRRRKTRKSGVAKAIKVA